MRRKLVPTVCFDWRNYFIVHKHGILQFINVYNMYVNRSCAELRWGDEVLLGWRCNFQIECNVIVFDHKNKTVKISQRAPVIIDEVSQQALKLK